MRLFGPYLWGLLADHFGKRLTVIRLTSVMALAAFSMLFAASRFEAVCASLAVLSAFWVASLPLVETLTFDHLRDRPSGYGRIRAWGSIGFVASVMGIGALLDHHDLSILLWINVLLLAGIALNTYLLPEARHLEAREASVSVLAILRQSKVAGLLAACFSMAAAHGALNVFYSIFLADHGVSKSVVGMMWTLGVLAEIVVFYFMPTLMRRFGLRTVLVTSLAAAVVRFLVIGYCAESPVLLLLAQLMHGLTFGAMHVAAIAAINRWFAGSARARGQALYSSVSFGAGGLVGGIVSGWTWDHWGGELTFVMSSLFALIGLCVALLWVRGSEIGAGK